MGNEETIQALSVWRMKLSNQWGTDMTTHNKDINGRHKVLLVVTLASRSEQAKPFSKENENGTYEHVSQLCEQEGIDLYVAHFANAINDSSVLSWCFKDGVWNMVELSASEIAVSYADLPQNFSDANELRNLLERHGVFFINDLQMSDALTDKVLTYELLPDFIPPTFDTSLPDLSARLKEASSHPDLRTDKIILKPRYGERGKGIEVIDFTEVDSTRVRNMEDYIVQPLMESDSGIPELGIPGRHDLRMLIYNGEIMDFFIRVAPTDTFICNQSHGGKISYFQLHELPEQFRGIAHEADQALRDYMPRYYSVDVGIGRSGKIWVYELNTMPGVVWNADATDKKRYVGMHKCIVEAIATGIVQCPADEQLLASN